MMEFVRNTTIFIFVEQKPIKNLNLLQASQSWVESFCVRFLKKNQDLLL